MLFKSAAIFALALPLAAAGRINVAGYVGNVCNGQSVFGFVDITPDSCYSVGDYRATGSILADGFEELLPRTLVFYYGDDCTTEVAHTNTEVCYVHSQTAVKSFRIEGDYDV